MSDTETFTELDVDERRALIEDLRGVGIGEDVAVSWPSSRSTNTVTVTGKTSAKAKRFDDDVWLYVKTTERKGDLVVKVHEDMIENRYHAPVSVHITGSHYHQGNRRLGELLDVEVLDDA